MKNLRSYLTDTDLDSDEFDEEEIFYTRKTKLRKMKETYDKEAVYRKPDDYYEDR